MNHEIAPKNLMLETLTVYEGTSSPEGLTNFYRSLRVRNDAADIVDYFLRIKKWRTHQCGFEGIRMCAKYIINQCLLTETEAEIKEKILNFISSPETDIPLIHAAVLIGLVDFQLRNNNNQYLAQATLFRVADMIDESKASPELKLEAMEMVTGE